MNLLDAQQLWKREMELEVAKQQRNERRVQARRRIEDLRLAWELGLNPEDLDGLGDA